MFQDLISSDQGLTGWQDQLIYTVFAVWDRNFLDVLGSNVYRKERQAI